MTATTYFRTETEDDARYVRLAGVFAADGTTLLHRLGTTNYVHAVPLVPRDANTIALDVQGNTDSTVDVLRARRFDVSTGTIGNPHFRVNKDGFTFTRLMRTTAPADSAFLYDGEFCDWLDNSVTPAVPRRKARVSATSFLTWALA